MFSLETRCNYKLKMLWGSSLLFHSVNLWFWLLRWIWEKAILKLTPGVFICLKISEWERNHHPRAAPVVSCLPVRSWNRKWWVSIPLTIRTHGSEFQTCCRSFSQHSCRMWEVHAETFWVILISQAVNDAGQTYATLFDIYSYIK